MAPLNVSDSLGKTGETAHEADARVAISDREYRARAEQDRINLLQLGETVAKYRAYNNALSAKLKRSAT